MMLTTTLELLNQHYQFNGFLPQLAPNGTLAKLTGTGGQVAFESRQIPVLTLTFEENTIEFELEGGSREAAAFFADLSEVMGQIAESSDLARKMPRTYAIGHETTAIAQIQVPHERLLSRELAVFLKKIAAPAIRPPSGRATLRLERLSWAVKFETQSPDFTYQPRTLTIEPRFGAKEGSNLYFTKSPVPPEAHLKLLREFEAQFVKPKSAKPRK
ncbi:MAG: hypothetical protein ACRD1Y_08525 [Terriglobales bacterium]